MEAPEQARLWQQKIDQAFPHGMLMTADDESDGRGASFPVPRPEVVSMQGMDPVVFIEIPEHNRNLSGVIVGWEPVQEKPCTVVRVTMETGTGSEDRDKVSRWSSNLSPGAVRAMREWRNMSLESSERHDLYRGGTWHKEQE